MPAPSQGAELHIDRPLSNIVVSRRPEGFIADQLLPITPVGKQSDMYWRFRHREFYQFQAGLSERAPGTEAKKVVMSVASDTYYARNYALGAEWTVEDAVNADEVLQWRQSNAEMLTDRLMLDYEMRIAGLVSQAANVSTTTNVASNWNDATNSRPFDDLTNYIEAFRRITGQSPNRLIIPQGVWAKLKLSEQLKGRIFGSNNGGVPVKAQLENLLDMPSGAILIPAAQVNTVSEFATFLGSGTLSDVWDNKVYLARVQLLAGRQTDTWLNAFRWTSPLFQTPFAVQAYPFDAKKKKFEIEVGYYQAEKVVSPDLGFCINSAI